MSGLTGIAVTVYDPWREVECVQQCGWQPAKPTTAEARSHVAKTGHETAIIKHSSIHYRCAVKP